MAETIAAANGIPNSTTMSMLEATTHIPIAQLTPLLPASASRSVKAVVTLTWPYSSRTGSVAFLLAEPDFRLRRIRGQVRVQFSGSSANAIAKSGITSGDEVILCLDGVEYVGTEAPSATPGRGVEFELKFTDKLLLQFRPEDSQDVKLISLENPDPEANQTKIPATPVSLFKQVTSQNVEEYSSPAFLKRERISYGSMFEEGYDPFEVEDGSVAKPSPEVEEPVVESSENSIEGPVNQHAPSITDEGVQTIEAETEVIAEATQTLEQDQPRTTEEAETNGIVQLVHAEAPLQGTLQAEDGNTNPMPPPHKVSDSIIPNTESRKIPSDNIDEKLPSSPQLRPLPSEGLPLVSPLVTNRVEKFDSYLHNEHTQDLEIPNNPYALPAESDTQILGHRKEDDVYDANPLHHLNDQSKSGQTTYNTASILSGDQYDTLNTQNTFPPHQQRRNEAEDHGDQLFAPYNAHGQDSYTSAGVYEETPKEQGQFVPSEMEEGLDQYNYPDPEQTYTEPNNWTTQPSMAYPDFGDSHQQTAISSLQPYSSIAPLSPSQIVDLTESSDEDENECEDEDAEGFLEVEDNSEQQLPNSAFPVEHGEQGFYYEARKEDEDEEIIYDDQNETDGYGQGYYDENDENMGSTDRGDYLEDYGNGSEEDYDEDSYSEEVQNVSIRSTKSQEFVRESSEESVEDEPMVSERALVNDHIDVIKPDAEMSETVLNTSGSGLGAQMDADESMLEPEDAKQSPPQENLEDEIVVALDSTEPMDIETSTTNPSATVDKNDVDNTTDNLDSLLEKLEEVGSETQLEQGSANTDSDVPKSDDDETFKDSVENFENEDLDQNSKEANAEKILSQGPESAEMMDDTQRATQIVPTGSNANTTSVALENFLPSPITVEKFNVATVPISTDRSIKDRAAKSGWARSSKGDTLFSKTFGIDGANDTSDANDNSDVNDTGDESDKANKDLISSPALPATELEDEPELIDESDQISQSQSTNHVIDTTTDHQNDQLPTPDDTQKQNVDENNDDALTSMSDLLQLQLREEMGEMDEDVEIMITDADIEKDPSADLLENEDMNSSQEESDTILDVAPDAGAIDEDDEMIDPESEDMEVQITKTEILELKESEITEIEVRQVSEEIIEGIAGNAEEGGAEEDGAEVNVGGEFEEIDSTVDEDEESEERDLEMHEGGAFEERVSDVDEDEIFREGASDADEDEVFREGVSDVEDEEFGERDSEIEQIEINVREAETTEFKTQQTLTKLAENSILGKDLKNFEITEEDVKQTIEETEAVADDTEAFVHTRSSKDPSPSPDFKRSSKGSVTVSPRQTRSKKLESVVEAIPPVTPTKSNKENERPSTRGSNQSKGSPSLAPDEEKTPKGPDTSAEMALLGLPESPTKAGHQLRAPATTDPKLRLTKYLRTDLSEFTTLKMLRFKMNSKLDILAIATSVPTEPQRAKSGPRHYTSTFTITDQTIAPSSVVEVKIFRPYRDALPRPEIGDGILLRDFSVLSVKGRGFTLKSEEESSWAVFKDEGTEIEVRGPPVEYGNGEKKHMKELREWFVALDDRQKTKLEKVSAAMEKDTQGKGATEKGKK
ncbi:3-dehydroshikimate dehydratase [Botrytis cinerea]